MEQKNNHTDIKKLSLLGVIATMGIVFGDLGTSPLYTMRAILLNSSGALSELLVYGSLSCIIWTLTLSTTIKYVAIALQADNNGEGGIFALFALVRRKSTWAAVLCMIGGAALLADGVITPSISVTSAVEGLRIMNTEIPVVPLVLILLALLFFIQQFGTNFFVGAFGPIMIVWFSLIGMLGFGQIVAHPSILAAFSPVYAYRFLAEFPGGFILLGFIFLCTTGVEALYADLGLCGRKNIRVAWTFVKICLLLNYFGQGAWLISHYQSGAGVNPFFALMPDWLLLPGIIIAIVAAIIASQAIISGSFTMISEAVSLNFWPWLKILHPANLRGGVFVPFVNWLLWIASSVVVLIFRESSNMCSAYGLAIAITEIMTTFLLSYYLYQKGINHRLIVLMLLIYVTLEGSFIIANLYKFRSGGWFTFLLALLYFIIMYEWFFGRKIKNRYVTFSNLNNYLSLFRDLASDESVPKTATNLVYVISANRIDQVESKVIYSIFNTQPKRADRYWFIHVDRVNDPNLFEYHVTKIIPDILTRIDFRIGFKVDPSINLYFRNVLDEMIGTGELNLDSGYESLKKYHVPGDFKFILIERIIPRDIKLPIREDLITSLHLLVSRYAWTDLKLMQLDTTNTITEKVPIIIDQPELSRIKRLNI